MIAFNMAMDDEWYATPKHTTLLKEYMDDLDKEAPYRSKTRLITHTTSQ